jgi:hypothetical protein
MRQAITSVVALITALLAASPAMAQERAANGREWGVAVSVAWEERSVLVTHGDGYRLLYIEEATDVRDAAGKMVALKAIRIGQRVEYKAEEWNGMWFAKSLAVARNVSASGSLNQK